MADRVSEIAFPFMLALRDRSYGLRDTSYESSLPLKPQRAKKEGLFPAELTRNSRDLGKIVL